MKIRKKIIRIRNLQVAISDDTFIRIDAKCTVEYIRGFRSTEIVCNTIENLLVDGSPLFSDEDELAETVGAILFRYIIEKVA